MSKHDDDTCPHFVRASLLEAENARLKAEVERLRKAGDTLADFFVPDIDDLGHNYGFKKSVESVISNWNAAKEGGAS